MLGRFDVEKADYSGGCIDSKILSEISLRLHHSRQLVGNVVELVSDRAVSRVVACNPC